MKLLFPLFSLIRSGPTGGGELLTRGTNIGREREEESRAPLEASCTFRKKRSRCENLCAAVLAGAR
eukprot:scaffold167518_cov31-Tisochrysis_lutea.AAC.1